ncbi:TRAP transporter substrate-binding protein [Shewanella yunxiaonensis]|uniref:TRAP transporter substrate-binding protein n=1 Tax=Shewanella yunxiaonensis TaxID=2829809 RepID=A0ABX7YVR9_9GAMM|nr:TRAP transporter substrate-binding protein [Shewanella yunxiaonensis]QUN06246.1 TRAP transporter substrate-binding protein [Shewanella yunxiaonensis]
MHRNMIKLAVGLMAGLGISCNSMAAEYTLRFAHHFPAVSSPHKQIFQAWADEVEQASNGRIKVELYPSSTLAKPPAQYDAVVNGIADITATIQGYTANRFPLTQVVELPGVAKNAENGSCIIENLYDEGLISQEYKNTKPLFLFTHGMGLIHTTDKTINTPEDLAGLRIRRPSAVVAKFLEQVGAQPVGMPAPESYQAMQNGVIDGVSLPWEGALVFRLNELTKKHTDIGGLYTLSFIVTMNKRSYNKLPADLKKVIDEHSGLAWSKRAGAVFDELDKKGRAQAVALGQEIVEVKEGINNPAWKPVLDKVTEEYLSELEAKHLPARKVYARAKELSQTCQ